MIKFEKTAPSSNIATELVCLYGQPGVGKSYFCAALDAETEKTVIFLDFDGGLRQLAANRIACVDNGTFGWDTMIKTLTEAFNEAKTSKKREYIFVVDTFTKALASLEAKIMAQYHVKINSDLGFKGWGEIQKHVNIFMQICKKIGGIIFICHEVLRETDTETGGKIFQAMPDIPQKRFNKIVGDLDHLVRLTTITDVDDDAGVIETRVLTGKPSFAYVAKSRGGIYSRNMVANWSNVFKAYKVLNK